MYNKNQQYSVVANLIKIQLIITILNIIVVSLVFKSLTDVLSVALGSTIVIVSSIVYASIAFSYGLIVIPNIAIKQHKKAMLTKFLVNFLLFVVVITLYKKCNYLLLFISYIITQSMACIVLLKK